MNDRLADLQRVCKKNRYNSKSTNAESNISTVSEEEIRSLLEESFSNENVRQVLEGNKKVLLGTIAKKTRKRLKLSKKQKIKRPTSICVNTDITNDALEEFMNKIDDLKVSIKYLMEEIDTLEELYEEILTSISPTTHRLNDKLKETIDNINAGALVVQDRIVQLKLENEDYNLTHEDDTAHQRLRETAHFGVMTQFTRMMGRYREVTDSYNTLYMKAVKTQLQLVVPEIKDEEVKTFIEGGEKAQKLVKDLDIRGSASLALRLIKEQYEDVVTIEVQISAIQQLFVELLMVIEQQGEYMDNVENHLKRAKAYASKAAVELGQTEGVANKNRKKWIIIFTLSVIAFGIVATFLFIILTGLLVGGLISSGALTALIALI